MAIVDDPEVDLGLLAERFGRWLQRQPGRRPHAGLSLSQASRANGFSNETYRVQVLAPGRADESLILRLPPARIGLFPDYDLRRQYTFMQRLEQAPGLRMAPCCWVETDASVLGRPFFVTRHVDGQVAADQPSYLREGWIADAAPAQRRRLWEGSFGQLEHLARVRWHGAMLDAVDWPDRSRPRWQQHLEHWTRIAHWGRQQLPDDGPDALLDTLQGWLAAYCPEHEIAGIVWGDARFGNIIYRDFEPAALLDWELAVIGDPMLDLAYMLFHAFLVRLMQPVEPHLPRLPGFGGDAGTVAAWCQALQRTPRDYRACWLFNAYKMLCIWQCKAALMLRSGTWRVDQALQARRGPTLRPHVGAVLEGGADAAFMH